MSTGLPQGTTVVRETMTRVPRQRVRDFEALPEGTLAQLIDGEIVMSPSPTYRHQRIIGNLFRALDDWTQGGVRGEVIFSPMDVYLGERDVFQPDLILITPERRHIIRDRIHGAPDLVVEVLSPSTGYYDLTKKSEVYASAGVREFWIVDPERKTFEIRAVREGQYATILSLQDNGRVDSEVMSGFSMDIRFLFAER